MEGSRRVIDSEPDNENLEGSFVVYGQKTATLHCTNAITIILYKKKNKQNQSEQVLRTL